MAHRTLNPKTALAKIKLLEGWYETLGEAHQKLIDKYDGKWSEVNDLKADAIFKTLERN